MLKRLFRKINRHETTQAGFVRYHFVLVPLLFALVVSSAAPSKGQTLSAQKDAPKVLLGGSGSSPQYYQTVVDELTDFLTSKGVAVKQADPGKTRDSYLEQVSAMGMESLLLVTVDVILGQPKDHLRVECFDRQGKKLWREEVGVVFIGTANKLAKNMTKKLAAHVGQEGLPLTPR